MGKINTLIKNLLSKNSSQEDFEGDIDKIIALTYNRLSSNGMNILPVPFSASKGSTIYNIYEKLFYLFHREN